MGGPGPFNLPPRSVLAGGAGLLLLGFFFVRPSPAARGSSDVAAKFEIPAYSLYGPLTWEQLPDTTRDDYTLGGKIARIEMFMNDKTTVSAVGRWPRADIDKIIEAAHARAPIGPYPAQVSQDVYAALDAHSVKGKRALVVGTLIPWVEAALHVYGAKQVVTVDFNPPELHGPSSWQTISIPQLDEMGCCFDVMFSFSSLEHDGLGRYGDPINPNGDIHRMAALRRFMSPGGLFFLGVPMGNDTLMWNAHRIYGPIRFPKLIEGWEYLGVYAGYKLEDLYSLTGGNYTQPCVVLRNS